MVAYLNAIFYLISARGCLINCGHFSYYYIIVGSVFCYSCAEVPTWNIDNLIVVICRSIDMKELVSSVNFIRLTLQSATMLAYYPKIYLSLLYVRGQDYFSEIYARGQDYFSEISLLLPVQYGHLPSSGEWGPR